MQFSKDAIDQFKGQIWIIYKGILKLMYANELKKIRYFSINKKVESKTMQNQFSEKNYKFAIEQF